MISVVLLACLVGLSFGAPQVPPRNVPGEQIAIISQASEHNIDGSYRYSYETANGIKAEATGSLKPANDPKDGNVVVSQGSYSFTGPDGVLYEIRYVADDLGGFQAQGAHIPTPPPIPPEIQKALDFIASQPPQPENRG